MKIKRFDLKYCTIQDFADEYNLVMEVHERSHLDSPTKYYAHFENAEIKEGSILASTYGNGKTEPEAINNYAKQISGKLMIVDAFKESRRREIMVPIMKDKFK